jgi:putative addiction module component (TIGR02574 family)
MTQNANQLLAEAMRLSESDRGDLAAHLIESLDPATEDDVELAWSKEIQQRIQEMRDGQVKPVPWDEARRMILEEDDAD